MEVYREEVKFMYYVTFSLLASSCSAVRGLLFLPSTSRQEAVETVSVALCWLRRARPLEPDCSLSLSCSAESREGEKAHSVCQHTVYLYIHVYIVLMDITVLKLCGS